MVAAFSSLKAIQAFLVEVEWATSNRLGSKRSTAEASMINVVRSNNAVSKCRS